MQASSEVDSSIVFTLNVRKIVSAHGTHPALCLPNSDSTSAIRYVHVHMYIFTINSQAKILRTKITSA